jgi:hypothetical protein
MSSWPSRLSMPCPQERNQMPHSQGPEMWAWHYDPHAMTPAMNLEHLSWTCFLGCSWLMYTNTDWFLCMDFISCSFFLAGEGSTRYWTEGFVLANQVLYPLSYVHSPFCFLAFLQIGSHVPALTNLRPLSYHLHFPHRWDYSHVLPCLACFWDKVSLTFAWTDLEPQSFYLCFPNSWVNRHVPSCLAGLYPATLWNCSQA